MLVLDVSMRSLGSSRLVKDAKWSKLGSHQTHAEQVPLLLVIYGSEGSRGTGQGLLLENFLTTLIGTEGLCSIR